MARGVVACDEFEWLARVEQYGTTLALRTELQRIDEPFARQAAEKVEVATLLS